VENEKKAKLERYLRNSSRFLWGLPRSNQKEAYAWLRSKGYDFDNGAYAHSTGQLLQKYGIEQIMHDIVVPRVKELFSEGAIDFLRGCWLNGMLPQKSVLDTYNIRDASPFLEVNSQFNYVERWGELAGLWFEEIEPMQR